MARQSRPSGNPDQREINRQQVVAVIRAAGQIARIDIAQETGVSPATVTAVTSELIRAGLVEEVAADLSRESMGRGRPRVALKVRGAAHLVAGIKVSLDGISTVLIDFEGTTVAEHEIDLPAPRLSPAALAEEIARALDEITAKIGRKASDISGLGVGLAGTVNAPEGFVHWSPSLTETNLQLRDLLEARLPMPVFLDNDVNLVAKAEQLFGEGRGVSDFIVVTIEQGVGMGIVIDGNLYRGTRGCGAELGHTKVHLDGALCRCGQRGCLEAYVSDYALLREAEVLFPSQSELSRSERLDALFGAARGGDHTARTIVDRASRMFAMGLANIVNIFDPKLIILSGERMSHDFLYSDEVIAAMRDEVVQVDAPPPEVRIHKWSDSMWAKGAAAHAMEGVTELAVKRLAVNA